MNPLLALRQLGQSVWLDHISRRLITDGTLQRLIDEDGLAGMTSNPTIFDKAIEGGGDYDAGLQRALDADRNAGNGTLVERLIVEDIQSAADVFRPVHRDSDGLDGFVSLEVSPASAHDTEATIAEARHLWQAVAWPNVMIKVPATREGIPAVFGQDQLPAALRRFGMDYGHMPGLGKRRHARRDSTNTGWRNVSFRGYADYMETQAFKESLNRCLALAHEERVVLMCAEAVPWRCHRSLIADALLARGVEVRDITSAMHARPHALTPWARLRGVDVTYPAADFQTNHVTSARVDNGPPVRGYRLKETHP